MMKRILSAASVCFCLAQMSRAENIRFISHRGESYDAPENTMAAFQLAVDRQTAGFECDVYLTVDNEIVCIHDATTTRTTDGSLTVAASTLAQLKALDAGSWKGAQFAGERIPTLSEALALARDGMEIYVEIKCGTEILPRLIQVMAAEPKATPARVVFICFSSAVISAVRQQFPAYRAYWLTSVSDSGGAPSPSAVSAIATMQANGAPGWTRMRMRWSTPRMFRRSRPRDTASMSGPSTTSRAQRNCLRWASRPSRPTAAVISRQR